MTDLEINNYILENYLSLPIKVIAKNLGRSQTLVRARIDKMKLVIPKEIIEERKKNSFFKKGSNPWNAGKTDLRVSKKSEFKKGQLPSNTLYDGAISIRNDISIKTGKLTQYKFVRLSLCKWELYHRYLWKKSFGEIPKKHIITFKDGNTLNCSIDNLECISMAENAKRNANRKKIGQTHRLNIEEGYQTPSMQLSDSFIASLIVGNNKTLQKEIINNFPEVIESKRVIQKLNRKIKEVQNGKTK